MPYFETNRPPANGSDPGDNTSNSLSVFKLLPVLFLLMAVASVCRCTCDIVNEPNRYGRNYMSMPTVLMSSTDPSASRDPLSDPVNLPPSSPEPLPPSPPADL